MARRTGAAWAARVALITTPDAEPPPLAIRTAVLSQGRTVAGVATPGPLPSYQAVRILEADRARDLKQAVPLEHYIADQVLTTKLERSGDRMKGICPIPPHDDTTPSFVVFPNGRWTCFGQCQRNGDICDLIGLVFGLPNFRDQVARLADYYRRQVAT